MTFNDFKRALDNPVPPPGLGPALEGLWWDAKGRWDEAHRCAQTDEGPDGAWVHAYLHRKEGNESNAGYWYRRAGRGFAAMSLAEEWEAIIRELLARK